MMLEVLENRRRDRNRARSSHQIPGRIERMNADVDQRAAARTFLLGEPSADAGRDPARTDPDRFGKINRAEFPLSDQLPCRPHGWCKAELAAEKIGELAPLSLFLEHLHFR